MKRIDYIKIGQFFRRFVEECKEYDQIEAVHILQFNDVRLTPEFLLLSGLLDKTYSAICFLLDDSEVVVFEKIEGKEKVVFSASIECSLKIQEKRQ